MSAIYPDAIDSVMRWVRGKQYNKIRHPVIVTCSEKISAALKCKDMFGNERDALVELGKPLILDRWEGVPKSSVH